MTATLRLFLIVSSCAYVVSQDAPFFIYCSSENCTESNNMPCERNPPCAPTGDCRELPMNEALRFTITHFHNQVRSLTATTTPGASKMRALQYNRDLERIAQCWINTCTMEKTSCLVTPQYKSFGQNLGEIDLFDKPGVNLLTDSASLWQEMLTTWADEVSNVNAELIQKLPATEDMYKYEHYIQMVTDYTAALGCAWSKSNDSLHFACFYGPPGGIPDHAVYVFGSYCTECPDGTECYRPLGLCTQTRTGVQHWKVKLRSRELSSGAELIVPLKPMFFVHVCCIIKYFFQ